MYRYIAFFWLKDCCEDNLARASALLSSLTGKITGLYSVGVHREDLRRDDACHLSVTFTFSSREACLAFEEHDETRTIQRALDALVERVSTSAHPIDEPVRQMPLLYAFIGPANRDANILRRMVEEGISGIRISLRHHSLSESMPIINSFREITRTLGVTPQVLIDHVPETMISECIQRAKPDGIIFPLAQDASVLADLRRLIGPSVRLYGRFELASDMDVMPAILRHADEIIIARDALDRHMTTTPESIPALQRHLVTLCRETGMPFMVSTGLLTSMVDSVFPSLAELDDIYYAVREGAHALMLAQEAYAGHFPVKAATVLRKTAQQALLP